VPFETVNFEISSTDAAPSIPVAAPAPEPKKTNYEKMDIDQPAPFAPFQGNIVTTKAEPMKKPGIIAAQNPINPALIANNQQKPVNLEESGTIVQKPGDKPINLDMNAFLGETQKTKKDIDIINEVF